MGLTSTERARRHRRHKAGDHRLCADPERCLTNATPQNPTRGEQLIEDLSEGLDPSQMVILEEAARIADRLDRLDAIILGTSGEWLRFRVNQDGDEVTVIVNHVLSEARQQAVALKQLLAELRQTSASAKAPPVPGSGGGDANGVTDLAARIAARRSQTPS